MNLTSGAQGYRSPSGRRVYGHVRRAPERLPFPANSGMCHCLAVGCARSAQRLRHRQAVLSFYAWQRHCLSVGGAHRLASAIDCAPTTKQWHASNKSPSCCGDVVVTLDAAHILAARKTALHPQKNADGHRSLICDAIGSGTDPSVIFCAFLWMSSGLLRAHGERTRQADPWNAFARGVLGGKYLIAVSARTVCARRIDSHPLSCRRCQEPPSTTCRLLDRLTLGGSRHRRRSDSRARRASSALAESSHGTFRSHWPGGTGG